MSDLDLYSTEAAGQKIGLTPSGVRRIAARYGIGQKIGERAWVFDADDLDEIQTHASGDGKPGRPRSTAHPPSAGSAGAAGEATTGEGTDD
jgi:hypothetical protein